MNVTQEDLERAIAKEPRLASTGIVASPRGAAFRENREQLRQQLQQFRLCVGFLGQCEVSKRISHRSPTSYQLKHIIEKWGQTYVGNGILIASIIHLQIPYKHQIEDGLNVRVAISTKSLAPERR